LADEHGWFLTDQFANPANVRVHEETTGPEILEQAGGRVGAFVAGVGTGGTLTGVGRYLKARLAGVHIVLADPVGSRLAHLVSPDQPDLDAPFQIEGIGGSVAPAVFDCTVVDHVERVTDAESFAMTKRLWCEEGLLVGGSSGTAMVAALRVARQGNLDGPVVVLLADSWDRYYSKPWMHRTSDTPPMN
jgi:cysteine synthase